MTQMGQIYTVFIFFAMYLSFWAKPEGRSRRISRLQERTLCEILRLHCVPLRMTGTGKICGHHVESVSSVCHINSHLIIDSINYVRKATTYKPTCHSSTTPYKRLACLPHQRSLPDAPTPSHHRKLGVAPCQLANLTQGSYLFCPVEKSHIPCFISDSETAISETAVSLLQK